MDSNTEGHLKSKIFKIFEGIDIITKTDCRLSKGYINVSVMIEIPNQNTKLVLSVVGSPYIPEDYISFGLFASKNGRSQWLITDICTYDELRNRLLELKEEL